MNKAHREMYEFAYALTREKGKELKQIRQNSKLEVVEKTSQMDLVTQHDVYIQNCLVKSIIGNYPGHGIIAEEENLWVNADINNYTWLIDPIDGTVNYYRFGKDYAISLALYQNGEPVFGMVYDVEKDMMYSSIREEGAFVNQSPFKPYLLRQDSLNKAVVAVSLRTMCDLTRAGIDIMELLSGVQAHRYLGCSSLELCMVAKGDYDLFISTNVYHWDIAAARIFLEKCGGYLCWNEKNIEESACSKLWVAAFRSPAIWNETVRLFPESIRDRFRENII